MTLQDSISIYGKIEYISMDAEGNIIIGLNKKSHRDEAIRLLKLFEGNDVFILIRIGKWSK